MLPLLALSCGRSKRRQPQIREQQLESECFAKGIYHEVRAYERATKLTAYIGPDIDLEAFYIISHGFPLNTTQQCFLCDSLITLYALLSYLITFLFPKSHSVTSNLILKSMLFY
jgi:hypothetical protein